MKNGFDSRPPQIHRYDDLQDVPWQDLKKKLSSIKIESFCEMINLGGERESFNSAKAPKVQTNLEIV